MRSCAVFVTALSLAAPVVLAQSTDRPSPEAKTAPAAATTEVVLTFPGADGTPLEAKLTLPADRSGPVPAVLYLHGAGPRTFDTPFRYVDADGQRQWGRFLDHHAGELAKRGIAFFRMSKRGCHATDAAPWVRIDRDVFSKATMTVLLDDYQKALAALRQRPEINPRQIVLLGASEGTRQGPMLALRSPAGIVGAVMMGYAADNARDTIVWQNSVGPWRTIQILIPATMDGALTRAEYDEAIKDRPGLAAALPFDAIDIDKDGTMTAKDLQTVNQPRLDAILKAVQDHDDDFPLGQAAQPLLRLSA
jgi:pimeloyl-ACP methyl ester carboxylesterase